jgi:TnpA family transposase
MSCCPVATYVREEALAQATAVLVNFQLQQPLAEAWGQGTTSSSDARVYGVPVRALNATFHPKYCASAGRGIGVYTHVSDLWIPFYTQVITCHVRQAPYILDGLLYHATHLEPREHYTDTHGYTELIFAVCHLLGIRFAPRLKDLPEQRLWRLPGAEVYPQIDRVLAGKLIVCRSSRRAGKRWFAWWPPSRAARYAPRSSSASWRRPVIATSCFEPSKNWAG